MNLAKNEHIKNLVGRSTIFICGEDEVITQHSIQQLLKLKSEIILSDLYFINPSADEIALLKEEITEQNYTIIQNIEEVNDFDSFNIIACGIPIDSNVFKNKVKKHANHIVIFFSNLGVFRRSWEGLGKNISVIEKSFNSFIFDIEPPKPHFSDTLHKSQRNESEAFFTNRDEALTLYRAYKTDINKRCAIIIGVKGIGKRTFINKLKNIGLTKVVDHYCINRNDDFTYVLKGLLGMFNVEYRDSEIPVFFNTYRVDPILKKLFSAFDREENVNLIFHNTNILYNESQNKFYDINLEIFFKHLLQRPSYRGNKVYLISEFDLVFPVLSPDIFETIYLGTMTAEYIKYILEHEFAKPERDSSAYATAIMQFPDKTIDMLIGGYPPIAHIFVDTCIEYSIDDVINKGFAYSSFKDKKLQELKEFIKLNNSEVAILTYLSLFRKHFTVEAAKVYHNDAGTILEQLKRRMLLEKVIYETNTVFYVPSFIQDYVLSLSSDEATVRANHNKIGDYYWESAENKNEKNHTQIEDYRLALYHYEASGNTTKRDLLLMRFTGIFLNTAYEFYKENHLEDAYSYYNLLYKQDLLKDEKHINYFLICNAKLNKTGTQQLFEKIAGAFSKNIFIQISFTNYLYSKGDYDTAKMICDTAKGIGPDNYAVMNLYAKILNKKGEKGKALQILDNEITKFQLKINRNAGETQALITYLMTRFSFIEYYTTAKAAMQNISKYLHRDGMPDNIIEDLFLQPIDKIAEANVINLFEQAAKSAQATKLLYHSYANFLKRQGLNSEAKQMLDKKHLAEFDYKIESNEQSQQLFETDQIFEIETTTTKELNFERLNQVIETEPKTETETEAETKTGKQVFVRKLHNNEIQNELTSYKEKAVEAQAKLDIILQLEPDNFRALAAKASCVQEIAYLSIFENAANDYYKEMDNVKMDMKMNMEQDYLAGSRISAEKKGFEVIKRLNERNIDLNNFGFLNLGGGDGTELFVEIENTASNYGLLMEYDHKSVKRFYDNQSQFYLKNPDRKAIAEVIECDLGDKQKFITAKELIRSKNLDGLVVTIHAVLHELTTRSHFKPFDFTTFFMRIYDLHDNIILFIREPGVPENWTEKIKIILKEEYLPDFSSILKRVNEIHFQNEHSNYELFDTHEIICKPELAIEALTNFFYKEDFEYEKDEQHTSITKRDLVSHLTSGKFEIQESEPFYSDSMKKNIEHYKVKFSNLKGEHVSLPQCFTYTIAQKGTLRLKT